MPADTSASAGRCLPRAARLGPYRICFVCLGNICRSPMAEVVLRAELARAGLAGLVEVDSAGHRGLARGRARWTGRARAELGRRGYDGSAHRARQFQPSWFAGQRPGAGDGPGQPGGPAADGAGRRRRPGRGWLLLRSFDPGLAGRDDPYQGRCPTPTAAPPRTTPWPWTWSRRRCAAWPGSSPRCWTSRRRNRAAGERARLAGPRLAERLERVTGRAVAAAVPARVPSTSARHYRVTLADGRGVFAKAAADGLGGIFEAEARGLRWLAEARAVRVPEVLGWDEATLAVAWLPRAGAGARTRPSGSAATWPCCTPPGRTGSARHGPGSSPASRWATAPATRRPWPARRWPAAPVTGRAGTPASGCCPTCAGPRTPARWTPPDTAAGRGGGQPDQRAGRAGRAAQPHPRRLLVRERAVVRAAAAG